MSVKPSESTNPARYPGERDVDGALRAAANLAPRQIPGEVGEEVRVLLWAYYNTGSAKRMEPLARAILRTDLDPQGGAR